MFKLLDRYITRELLGPFGVALLTFVVLVTGHILFTVVQVIVEHGVPPPNIANASDRRRSTAGGQDTGIARCLARE